MLKMDVLFRLLVDKKASDLHLCVGLPPQFRVNGELLKSEYEALAPGVLEELAFSIVTDEQKVIFNKNKELDISYSIPGLSRFRINLYRQRGSIGIAIRLIPFEIPDIDELGIPQILKEFVEKPSGLFLVTGPIGSGKSTTLAAMIEHINQRKNCRIISIEDPIEYLHKHKMASITQREIGQDTNSFDDALKHVFRQDPNIVMIGEMRDLETIHTALTLAETGHLILATLHVRSAVHAISRIVDVFPPYQQEQIRVQLSLVLLGVMVQQLIPKRDASARVAACEVMTVNAPIRNLIRENNLAQINSCIQTGRRLGMRTMNQALVELVEKNVIGSEEAQRRTTDSEELVKLLSGNKGG